MLYEQTASAEFLIGEGSATLKVEGVPYLWDSGLGNRDSQASYAVARYIGKHSLSQGKPITLLWVSSKPAKRKG